MNEPEECAAYAEHLHHEHSRLNRLLLEIGHEIDQFGRPNAATGLLKRLEERITDLSSQLKAHFAEEEDGGCLEEAVTRCPSLAAEVRTTLEEHLVLDRLLYTLLAQLSDPAVTPTDLQKSWHLFYAKIQAHEAAETKILQMAFGAQSADYDIEGDE
jgi:hemerythrin HHE cation binding domain-containing protein